MMIRKASLDDVVNLAALHADSFEECWSVDSIRASLGMVGVMAWLATNDEQPVGFMLLRRVLDEAEILTLAIDSKLRRKGIATQLLAQAVKSLAEEAVSSVFLEVGERNEAAIGLYAAYGFKQIGRRKDYYQRIHGAEDALTMEMLVNSVK